jgi:hypothetical protein
MDTALPAADPASPWMKHLEQAHRLAHAAARAVGDEAEPSPHLGPAARHLERGLAAVYDAFDGRADRLTAINLAHSRFWDAAILVARAGLPRALAALQGACGELVGAEERFPLVPLAPPAAPPLQAGTDLPPLHTVERPSLTPSFRAPPIPEPEEEVPVVVMPEPTTFAELAAAAAVARRMADEQVKAHARRKALPAATEEKPAEPPPEPPPGFAFLPLPPLDEDAFVRRWARECFEEVGMIGIQRTPLVGDDWRACQALEKRLIASVDAIAALGPIAVASLEPLALDAPAVNPMAVFAITMIGGCLDGRDSIAGAERVLHHFGPADPAAAEPFAAAMKLCPNPFVPTALRSLHASTERGCRAIAVEVLAYRGWLTPDELSALADDEDPILLALALPALAAARHPDIERALVRALAHDDLGLQEAALDAMALAAHPQAASAARTAAGGPLGDRALVALAIVAAQDDARWLLDRMKSAPTPGAIEAVGWSGLVEAVPALIGLLESEEDGVPLAAGAALDRLLGANLIDKIEIMPEAIDDVPVVDPDPDPPAGRLALQVSDPRDQPPAGSPETLEVPSADPAKWRAHWAEHGRRHDPKLRLRRGNPYSPSVSLYELDRLPLPPVDRRRLHRELCARTGKLTAFDPHDFVVVQEQSLMAWASLVKASAETPGSWGRPGAR